MNKSLTVLVAIAVLVVILGIFNIANTIQLSQTRISNTATITSIGVSVWQDSNLTIQVGFIDWGVIDPGENKTLVYYVKSEANIPSTLSLTTENWQPSNASTWISLSWNLEGVIIDVAEAVEAQLTLSVSPDIENITSFSFDIVISGSG